MTPVMAVTSVEVLAADARAAGVEAEAMPTRTTTAVVEAEMEAMVTVSKDVKSPQTKRPVEPAELRRSVRAAGSDYLIGLLTIACLVS